jgi:hypothetical protein
MKVMSCDEGFPHFYPHAAPTAAGHQPEQLAPALLRCYRDRIGLPTLDRPRTPGMEYVDCDQTDKYSEPPHHSYGPHAEDSLTASLKKAVTVTEYRLAQLH